MDHHHLTTCYAVSGRPGRSFHKARIRKRYVSSERYPPKSVRIHPRRLPQENRHRRSLALRRVVQRQGSNDQVTRSFEIIAELREVGTQDLGRHLTLLGWTG